MRTEEDMRMKNSWKLLLTLLLTAVVLFFITLKRLHAIEKRRTGKDEQQ